MVQLSEVGHTIMDGGNCLWQTRMGENSPTIVKDPERV
jgi:hypothetical protein